MTHTIPMADFHQSEYVGEHFKAIRSATGFSVCMTVAITRIRLVYGPMADTLIRFSQNVKAVASSFMKMFVDDTPELSSGLPASPDGRKGCF